MMHTVRAYLRRPGGRVARDLGDLDIEFSGALRPGAIVKLDYQGKPEFGLVDTLERSNELGKPPVAVIIQRPNE